MEARSKRDEIIEVASKLFVYTDYQKWAKLQSEVFTESVLFDMSSVGAGPAKKLKAIEICDMWRTGFDGIDAIHHQAGNFLVTFESEGNVSVFCYAIASHFKNAATQGKTREFVGSYDLHFVLTDIGWRIDAFKYNLKYATGNTELK